MKMKARTMWRRIDESTGNELRCDWCGFSSDNENRFTEIGDQTVCRMCLSRSKYDEGLQEDVLDMADREDELVWMIQDTFWHLADLGDQDILRELIENCVELEKVKPGRLKEIISDEF
jgi:hypothetical protein